MRWLHLASPGCAGTSASKTPLSRGGPQYACCEQYRHKQGSFFPPAEEFGHFVRQRIYTISFFVCPRFVVAGIHVASLGNGNHIHDCFKFCRGESDSFRHLPSLSLCAIYRLIQLNSAREIRVMVAGKFPIAVEIKSAMPLRDASADASAKRTIARFHFSSPALVPESATASSNSQIFFSTND